MRQYPEDLFTAPMLGKLGVEEGRFTRREVKRSRRSQIVQAMNRKRIHLGQIMVDAGVISDSDLDGLLETQRGMNLFDLPAFEEFKIVERVGVGANAQVFRAVQRKVDREVAL